MRALPPIIIILIGIIAPPAIAYAIAGATGVVILYAVTAPSVLLLALLAPKVSTSPRGPEDRTVEGEPSLIPNQSKATVHTETE